jgi:hypothetical protein
MQEINTNFYLGIDKMATFTLHQADTLTVSCVLNISRGSSQGIDGKQKLL